MWLAFNVIFEKVYTPDTKDVIFEAKLNNPSVLKNKVKNKLQFDIYAELKRSDFNATGYQYIVGDIINLKTRVELLLLDN